MSDRPSSRFFGAHPNAIRALSEAGCRSLKTEIARIQGRGYISNYKTQEEEGKLVLRVYLKSAR